MQPYFTDDAAHPARVYLESWQGKRYFQVYIAAQFRNGNGRPNSVTFQNVTVQFSGSGQTQQWEPLEVVSFDESLEGIVPSKRSPTERGFTLKSGGQTGFYLLGAQNHTARELQGGVQAGTEIAVTMVVKIGRQLARLILPVAHLIISK